MERTLTESRIRVPRVIRELIADPLEVEADEDIHLGAIPIVENEDDLPEDNNTSVDNVLSGIWQEAEAEALVFLAQYSLQQGVSMYGEAAI